MEKKWEAKSPIEKRDELLQRWLNPSGIKFASPEVEKNYKERVTLFKDALELKKEPERVPIFPLTGFFPAYYNGNTPREMMYDYGKLNEAFKKYVVDFQPDAHGTTLIASPGKFYDILDYKLYSWPGHGVAPQYGYQFNEGEYMMADEYDALIEDPSYFFQSVYFPRIFGALQPFRMFAPMTNVLEMYGSFSATNFIPFGLPDVQAAYQKLSEAGGEVLKWIGSVAQYDIDMKTAGFPGFFGGGCKAPFDTLGDTLRGTKGIMIDMYRQPDKLLKALDVLTPIMIKMGASAARLNGHPIVFMPLHKGADGFLSEKQFNTFYWPTLRRVFLGLIAEGCIPFPWAEGSYNTRLDLITDIPTGSMLWGFDATDMAKVKTKLGHISCISGNMPLDLLNIGTPQQVKDYVNKLIQTCADGGGYIMMNGAAIDEAKPENMRAWIQTTKELGKYH